MPRAKKALPAPPVCPTCAGEGQTESFLIVGRGKNATRLDTWALCFDCDATGHAPEGR